MSAGAVEVHAAPAGATMRLRVKPGARRARLVGPHGGALKLEVVAAPEKGRANRAVEALLATQLGLAGSAVRLVVGETSQDKVVEIGLAPAELVAALRGIGIEATVG